MLASVSVGERLLAMLTAFGIDLEFSTKSFYAPKVQPLCPSPVARDRAVHPDGDSCRTVAQRFGVSLHGIGGTSRLQPRSPFRRNAYSGLTTQWNNYAT